MNEVAAKLRQAVAETRAAPYSDDAHRGLVRYAQIVVERRSLTAQVVIVTNGDTPAEAAPLLATVESRLGTRLHSLFWNGNPARTNTILGPHWQKIRGAEWVEERIGGARVFYPPGAFGQSHLELADRVVETVHGWVQDGARVVEFYAGVGPIGLGLVRRSRSVTFNEAAAESLRGLGAGIAALDDGIRERALLAPGPAGSAAPLAAEADVVIVDPPRKGLDRALRDALTTAPPTRLVYVACGLDTFLGDAAALVSSGAFRLGEVRLFDLFPHTDHVEAVARFERAVSGSGPGTAKGSALVSPW